MGQRFSMGQRLFCCRDENTDSESAIADQLKKIWHNIPALLAVAISHDRPKLMRNTALRRANKLVHRDGTVDKRVMKMVKQLMEEMAKETMKNPLPDAKAEVFRCRYNEVFPDE